MASSLAQDFVQADRLIKRRYFQIPRDQKELLDSDDAWSENLSRGPHSMVNVPPAVVDDVKNLSKRQNADSTIQPLPVQPASPNPVNAPPRSSPHERAVSSPEPENGIEDDNEGDVDDDVDDDEGSILTTWSASQPRLEDTIQYAEQALSHLSSKREEPPVPVRNEPPSSAAQSEGLEVQVPEGLSQDFQAPVNRAAVTVGNEPPSSAAQSEGLEIQIPEALSQEIRAPVNRAAVPTVATISAQDDATPPSAQVEIIPSSFVGKEQIDGRQPPAKKQRKVEEAASLDKEPEPRELSSPPKASAIPLSMVPGSYSNSPTTTILTPPLITQASSAQPRQHSPPRAVSQESSSNFTATWEGRRAPMATQQENLIQAPASNPPQPEPQARVVALKARRISTTNSTRQSLPHTRNRTQSGTPYEEFKAAYPDYQESTSIFVNALLNVESLKRDWALPEFLYDDFVRAFSTGYLQYIAMSIVQKADHIMTAVQWYNDRIKSIEYRQNVITKHNIHDMVKAHAAEARKVRESIGGSGSGSEHEGAVEDPDEEMADEDEQDEHVAESAEEAEQKEGTSALMGSPEFHVSSPGLAEVDTTAALAQSEALMTQLDAANTEKLSFIGTANGSDRGGRPLSEEPDHVNRLEIRSPLAKEVNVPVQQLDLDRAEESANNLIQTDAEVDETAEENEEEAPNGATEDDEPEKPGFDDHIMEDNMARPRGSAEPSINYPELEVPDIFALDEDEPPVQPKGPRQGEASPSHSFVSQEDLHMEDYAADDESHDDLEARVEIGAPGTQQETHRQTQDAVITKEARHNGATPEVNATPGSTKSSAARMPSTGTPRPVVQTPRPVVHTPRPVVQSELPVPRLSSSPPPPKHTTIDTGGDEPAHDGPAHPIATKEQDWLALGSQINSSDEESDAFDPPPVKVAVPRSELRTSTPSASRIQAQKLDAFDVPRSGMRTSTPSASRIQAQELDAFDIPPVKVAVPRAALRTSTPSASRIQAQKSDGVLNAFVPPVKAAAMPPPRAPAGSSPATKARITSRTTVAGSDSSARVPILGKGNESIQKGVIGGLKVMSRVPNGPASRTGRSGSPVSSERSYANVPMSKKRVRETKDERSRRLKEHFRKRMSGATPSSTAASRQ